ncbi:response regulator [Terribacillus saccharophilus]|uniref:response regulator n=1 Tax=Terribacillus saccharophilus TaxID=361277 RepID=UPI003982816E
MKVLLVDDEKNGRDVLRTLGEWEQNGVTVLLEASDGKEALELIASEQPDIIFTDIKMPRMNGIELMEQLHTADYRGKCILVTGYDDYQFMRKAIQFNSFDYLLKPIDPEAFAKVLENVSQATLADKQSSENEAEVLGDARRLLQEQRISALCTGKSEDFSILHEVLPKEEKIDLTLLSFYHMHQPAPILDCLTDELHRYAIGDVFRFLQEENLYIILSSADHWLRIENWLRQHLDLPVRIVQERLHVVEEVASVFERLTVELTENRYRTIRRLDELESEQRGRDIVSYVQRFYMEDVSLERLSKLFFLSKEHISRKFKQETGMTLSRFVTDCRMKQAKQWLEKTDQTIYDIARLLGYQDEVYFSKLFKKEAGLTPTAYRIERNEQEGR